MLRSWLVLSWDRAPRLLRTTVLLEVLVSRTTSSSLAGSVSSLVVFFLAEAPAVLEVPAAQLVPLVSLDCSVEAVTRSMAHQSHALLPQ
jgi:hypothetical protein